MIINQLFYMVFKTTSFSIYSLLSLMSLLSYFHIEPQVLSNPAGPLSLELSPSTIAEANAAVNGVQQAKTKETKKREIDHAHCTHVRIRY